MPKDTNREQERWLSAVGQAVRHYRKELDVSQEELGYRAGLHRTYVSDLERGQRNATVWTLVRLAETLGVEPSEILRRAEAILEDGRQ